MDMLPEVMVGRGDGDLLPLVVGDELIVDSDVVVVVRHASIVPEEERKARAKKRNPKISQVRILETIAGSVASVNPISVMWRERDGVGVPFENLGR